MADAELGVMLEPTNDLQDEVGEVQADVVGGSGDISPAQRDQQQSVVAGGVSKGLAGAAVLAGILSQLKAVTAPLKAIFGIISRTLVPIIEDLADTVRPLVQFANQAVRAPEQAAQGAIQFAETGGGFVEEGENFNRQFARALGIDEENIRGGRESGENVGPLGALIDFVTDPSSSADQTGEQTKQNLKNNVEEASRDKTGAFK